MAQTSLDEVSSEIATSAAWRHAAEAILAGIRHDLNGRIGTVSGLVQLARLDGALDDESGDMLESELARMEHLSGLIETAFLDRDRGPEPIVLSELLRSALELLRLHRGLESASIDLDIDDDVAVTAPRTPFLRTLVVLLAGAARNRPRASISVHVRRDDDHAVLRIAPIGNGATAATEGTSLEDVIEAARGVTEALRGTIQLEPDVGPTVVGAQSAGGGVVLRIPIMEGWDSA